MGGALAQTEEVNEHHNVVRGDRANSRRLALGVGDAALTRKGRCTSCRAATASGTPAPPLQPTQRIRKRRSGTRNVRDNYESWRSIRRRKRSHISALRYGPRFVSSR